MPIRLMLSFLLSSCFLCGQNLVPNGGFEDINFCPENLPERGIEGTAPWYIIGDKEIFTPDLFHNFCPLSDQRASASQFWNKRFTPFEGNAYAGIAYGVLVNGVFFTEAMGVPLNQALKAGKPYFFGVQVRSKGLNLMDNDQALDCRSSPRKSVNIFLSDQPINQVIEYGQGQAVDNTFATGERILADSSAARNESSPTGWATFSGCFVARGGEKHLGITGPIGKVASLSPPCEIDPTRRGFFHQGYYDFDNVVLVEMPEKLEVERVICEDDPLEVRLEELVPLPMFENAAFRWEDGSADAVRMLSEPGIYQVAVVLPCTEIPLQLSVEKRKCTVDIFVPNAFSPNADGINDDWQPLLRESNELPAYRLRVFDRWGNLLFQTQDRAQAWTGRNTQGQACPPGPYVWMLEYTLNGIEGEKRQLESGQVMLMR